VEDHYKSAVRELFEKIDTENDGVIDLCEFSAAVTKYVGFSDQEAINDVFNKVCSRMNNKQKIMELSDLENLIFVWGNKYSDQPLEIIFKQAVISKLNQPLLSFEDDLVADWLDFRSANDYKWFGIGWNTCWVDVHRQRREIRVWKDNSKRELTQRIGLTTNNVTVRKGARDTTASDRKDSNQFYIMITGRIYNSVFEFRTYSNTMRDAWWEIVRSLITDNVQSPNTNTQIKLILGTHENQESTRILRFDTANPLASEVLIKVKKFMVKDGDAFEKFGLMRDLNEVKLLCRGKILKPIEQLTNGDTLYLQTSPKTNLSPSVAYSPRLVKHNQLVWSTPSPSSGKTTSLSKDYNKELPKFSETDFLAQLEEEDDERAKNRQYPSSIQTTPRISRLRFKLKSWKSL